MSVRRTAILTVALTYAVCGQPVTNAGENDFDRSAFVGLNGRDILNLIRKDFRPEQAITDRTQTAAIVSAYARNTDGGYIDYFSSANPMSYDELTLLPVVPLSWWGTAVDNYVKSDLHNLVPANDKVTAARSDYPPGKVADAVYDNGFWRSGIGSISGMQTNFYEPADKYKGDFARIYLYMASVYPQPLWYSRAAMLFEDGYYPLLTTYGRELLMAWHRSDPIDEFELTRNNVIAGVQGHGNPFVSLPELAEYIWGRHSDETYDPQQPPQNPDDDPQTEPVMLKARYSISSDRRIDFRSPYVDAGSEWTFDGKPVSTVSISLDEVTPGRHEITYSNDRRHGKVIIFVEQ